MRAWPNSTRDWHVGGRTSGPQVRVPRQQAERDHHVRLAATHRLGQLEHRLVGLARQPQQALTEELRHAVGDVVAREELAAVAFVADEVGQVLDTLAHPVVVDDRVEAAGLLDGLDHELAPLPARLLFGGGCGDALDPAVLANQHLDHVGDGAMLQLSGALQRFLDLGLDAQRQRGGLAGGHGVLVAVMRMYCI